MKGRKHIVWAALISLVSWSNSYAVEAEGTREFPVLIIETAAFPKHTMIMLWGGGCTEVCEAVFPNPHESLGHYGMRSSHLGPISNIIKPGSYTHVDPSGKNEFVEEAIHAWEHGVDLLHDYWETAEDGVKTINEVIDHVQDWPLWDWSLSSMWMGDADLNGIVGFGDFLVLSENFGSTNASWDEGDFDGDADVDMNDFLLLSNNYGAGTN